MQTPRFLSLELVLRIHDRQIDVFGGMAGVRDMSLLESALAQPQATFGGQLLHPILHEQAAAYLYHLAMNHPFIDGNKRTAFAAMDTFLRLNGKVLSLTDEEAYNLVLNVVRNNIEKTQLSDRLKHAIENSEESSGC